MKVPLLQTFKSFFALSVSFKEILIDSVFPPSTVIIFPSIPSNVTLTLDASNSSEACAKNLPSSVANIFSVKTVVSTVYLTGKSDVFFTLNLKEYSPDVLSPNSAFGFPSLPIKYADVFTAL